MLDFSSITYYLHAVGEVLRIVAEDGLLNRDLRTASPLSVPSRLREHTVCQQENDACVAAFAMN